MDIESLTVGELKQVAALAKGRGGCKPKRPLEQKRVVLIVDRGWIFAGDQSKTSDGYIRLSNAVHVLRWEGVGFAKMVKDWKSDKVHLRKCADVEVPSDSVIFRVPVEASWGLK